MNYAEINTATLTALRTALTPLVGTQFGSLALPMVAIQAFEPSQIGTIVGSLMDALIPHLTDIPQVGLRKHAGILGEREGYPDYFHDSGIRVELKLLYIDNPQLQMKRPPTKREPSARLTQKVTVKNVVPSTDALLIVGYQLRPHATIHGALTPTIIELDVFSVIELVRARDNRLTGKGGRWFGNYETPCVLSRVGRAKLLRGESVSTASYGRKESEGQDYNEDTNFGKLARIPHLGLQQFLRHCVSRSVGYAVDSIVDEGAGTDDVITAAGRY
jgi:hypothetical protein